MAILLTSNPPVRLSYKLGPAPLADQHLIWGGGWVKFFASTRSQTLMTLTDHDNKPLIQLSLHATADTSQHELHLCQTLDPIADTSHSLIRAAMGAADTWHHVLFEVSLIDGANGHVRLWIDGVANDTSQPVNTLSNGHAPHWGNTAITIGGDAEQGSQGCLVEDVLLCSGAAPTRREIDTLQRMFARKALLHTQSTLIFNADLLREELHDRISLKKPQYTAQPIRSFGPMIDHGRAPTIIILGDPQHWGECDGTWDRWSQWVVDWKDRLQIKAVLCVGDWVHVAKNASEWHQARKGVDRLLAGGICVIGTVGNHDSGGTRILREMMTLDALPPSLFHQQPTFAGAMPPVIDTDHYTCAHHLPGLDNWLVITLPWFVTYEQLDWAIAKAAQHPECKVIINTHAFLNSMGEVYDDSNPGAGNNDQYRPTAYAGGYASAPWPGDPGGRAGVANDGWWATHLSRIPNLTAIVNGHDIVGQRSTAQLQLYGQHGNSVLCSYVNKQEILSGNGLMQLWEIDGEHITALSYFQVINQFSDEPHNAFNYTIKPPCRAAHHTPGQNSP